MADTVPPGMFGDVLTRRQLEIAKFVAAGLKNGEIGSELEISIRTVEKHLERIYEKTDVPNRVMLAKSMII